MMIAAFAFSAYIGYIIFEQRRPEHVLRSGKLDARFMRVDSDHRHRLQLLVLCILPDWESLSEMKESATAFSLCCFLPMRVPDHRNILMPSTC